MSFEAKPLHESLNDWFAHLRGLLRAALSTAAEAEDAHAYTNRGNDPDFEGWLHNDPMVTGNPASRYSDDAPGYLTGNGLGSLEIGAADD